MDDDLLGYLVKGRYKLIDKLAQGAFGSVYVSRDLETNYLYAVKLLHEKFALNTEVIARFQREAHLPLSIRDPHIVQVIDYGFDSRFYFIVMDYVDGHNLRVLMTRFGRLPVEVALNYARQVAMGLEAANRQGVVHRDLKPQNILVTNRGEVKITDFGLARGKNMPTITETDEFMGTAYYISPEQIASGHSVDIRADLYSLAAILFEMLAGRPPYRGNNVLELIDQHRSAPIPSLCQLRPDLPFAMDLFFQKALAKLPEQRYQTPAEFLMALDYLQRSWQSSTAPSSSLTPIAPPSEKLPAMAPQKAGKSPSGSIELIRSIDPLQQQGAASHAAEEETIANSPRPEKARQAKPEEPAPARLVHLKSGQVFPLRGQEMIIGRQDPKRHLYPDISLADPMIGRRHARIRNRQGTFTVEDLHSRNRTRLNGNFLPPDEEHPLHHGDILRFGNIEMRFEQPDAAASASP
jgi:serine/threonine protein kinase